MTDLIIRLHARRYHHYLFTDSISCPVPSEKTPHLLSHPDFCFRIGDIYPLYLADGERDGQGADTPGVHEQGDVWPENGDGVWEDWADGDGFVDVHDLAELLGQFGDDCTWW